DFSIICKKSFKGVFLHFIFDQKRKPANKKSSVFLKKISKIRFDILCITFKPPEMPALKVVI
ncbi:MAG: hypothetical protein WBO33_08830, partial [Blautia wexlerae]